LEAKEEKPTHHDTRVEERVGKASFKRISPSAKMLLIEHGLDASSVMASGPRGTMLKGDVLAALKSGTGSPKTSSKEKISHSPQAHSRTSLPTSPESKSQVKQPDSYEDLPNSQIRKVSSIEIMDNIARFLPFTSLSYLYSLGLKILHTEVTEPLSFSC